MVKFSTRVNLENLMGSLTTWYESIRQIKSPKNYFRDNNSRILHALIGLQNQIDLDTYPKQGSFWEGFALEEITDRGLKEND